MIHFSTFIPRTNFHTSDKRAAFDCIHATGALFEGRRQSCFPISS
jgi:hypothetical protein